jgi:hypothetical protein
MNSGLAAGLLLIACIIIAILRIAGLLNSLIAVLAFSIVLVLLGIASRGFTRSGASPKE